MALVEFSAVGLQLFLQKQSDNFGNLPVGGKSSLSAFGDRNPILYRGACPLPKLNQLERDGSSGITNPTEIMNQEKPETNNYVG